MFMIGGIVMVVMYIVLGIIVSLSFITGVILTVYDVKHKKSKSLPKVVPLYSVSVSDKSEGTKNE